MRVARAGEIAPEGQNVQTKDDAQLARGSRVPDPAIALNAESTDVGTQKGAVLGRRLRAQEGTHRLSRRGELPHNLTANPAMCARHQNHRLKSLAGARDIQLTQRRSCLSIQ
jgi:hypothetical protein